MSESGNGSLFDARPLTLIAAERMRQESVEGWTPDHDDLHDSGELATAAACYCYPDALGSDELYWPWDEKWWKPDREDGWQEQEGEGRIRELVKAGALIVAEIERIQRLRAKP